MEHKITALKLQQRNRQRVNVYLDGEFAFGLARIVAAWLQVGQVITDEKIAELQNSDSHEKAYQQALKFINYRQRTEAEVRRNLEEHNYTEEAIQQALERLQSSGLLDDQRFAQSWVDNRSELRPRSRKALSLELRRHGLDDQAISQAVEAVNDEDMAYQAGIKQARKYRLLEWMDFRQKLSNFLLRRGFGYDVVSPTVKRIWDETRQAQQDDEEANE